MCKQGIRTKKRDHPQLPISDFTVVFKLQYKLIIYENNVLKIVIY